MPILIAANAGFARPFYQVYDADLYYTYNALAFNQGLPQLTYDHTGYSYSLILAWWLKATHFLGFLQEGTLLGVRTNPDTIEALSQVVIAGRAFSALLAIGFAATFALIVSRLKLDRTLGALMGAFLAATPSLQLHAIILRPELTSAYGIMLGFGLIALSHQHLGRASFLYLAGAAAAVYLGVLGKLQAIIPALLLPVFGLAWGQSPPATAPLRQPDSPSRILIIIAAAILVLPFASGHYFGSYYVTDHMPPPVYAWITVVYVAVMLASYSVFYGCGAWHLIQSAAALLIGLSLAYMTNYFHFNLSNPGVLSNFLDFMKAYGGATHADMDASSGYAILIEKILLTFMGTLTGYFSDDFFAGMARQILVVWCLLLMFWAARAHRYKESLSMAILVFGGLGVSALFGLRGLYPYYQVYFEFLFLLALALFQIQRAGQPHEKNRKWLIRMLPFLIALQAFSSYQMFVAHPYETGFRPKHDFCAWQKEWAPILSPEIYEGDACWSMYQSTPQNKLRP